MRKLHENSKVKSSYKGLVSGHGWNSVHTAEREFIYPTRPYTFNNYSFHILWG